MRSSPLLLLTLAVAASIATDARAQPAAAPLRLVTSAPISPTGAILGAQSVDLLMRRAGFSYTLTSEPNERALASFKAGLYDADVLRVPQFERVFPAAIRVDPHLLSTTVTAFSRSADVAPGSWAELMPYSVAYVRGVKVVELNLLPGQRRELTSSAAACLGMVVARRVDVCVLNAEVAPEAAPLADGAPLHRTVLARIKLHVWVAPGHEALAQTLSQALKALVASGELARVAGENRQP
jgi:ABC-type amino acid transport substrate-binding protein